MIDLGHRSRGADRDAFYFIRQLRLSEIKGTLLRNILVRRQVVSDPISHEENRGPHNKLLLIHDARWPDFLDLRAKGF